MKGSKNSKNSKRIESRFGKLDGLLEQVKALNEDGESKRKGLELLGLTPEDISRMVELEKVAGIPHSFFRCYLCKRPAGCRSVVMVRNEDTMRGEGPVDYKMPFCVTEIPLDDGSIAQITLCEECRMLLGSIFSLGIDVQEVDLEEDDTATGS